MSGVKGLITELEEEDEQRKKENEKHFEEQNKKYEEMQKKIKDLTDEYRKITEEITKGLEQLIANKHTIEQAVKQTENLPGLSVPQEQHENVIELISKMTEFLNKIELLNNQCKVLPSEIHQYVAAQVQHISDELKNTGNEFVDIQTLYQKIKQLKDLSSNDSFDDDLQDEDLNRSIF